MGKDLFHSGEDLCLVPGISYPDITIKAQSLTFLTGPSGTGKSCYLQALNRTMVPKAGSITCRDRELSQLDVLAFRRQVLLAPQETYLKEGSIQENFAYYYSMRGEVAPDGPTMKRFLEMVEFPVEPSLETGTLSGGERKRVYLAIFLSAAKKVLLLDEPTASFDKDLAIRVFTNICAYVKERAMTLVCVCHDPELVERFSEVEITIGGARWTELP